MLKKVFLSVFFACFYTDSCLAEGKATEGSEVVLNKIYPKESRLEISGGAGLIMNQSYLGSFFGTLSGSYYPAEHWGLGLRALFVANTDNEARNCIETFYNDPNERIEPECLAQDPDEAIRDTPDANIGPAYVPIREVQGIYTAEFLWNPVYGKQIVMMSGTSYFDLQIAVGGGVVTSQYYELRRHIRDQPDKSSRGTLPSEENPELPPVGVAIDEADANGLLYGEEGRPAPRQELTPTTSLGLTQRFHFARRFSLTVDFYNYTLFGTENGLETYFTIGSALGVRF